MFNSDLDEKQILERGRQLERLLANKDFQNAIIDGFITQGRLDLTKGFEGSVDAIEGLKSIAYFDDYIEQSMEYAKQLQLKD